MRPRRILILQLYTLLMSLFAAAANAGDDPVCDELWLTRNLIFDRVGYCFGSTLGQTVFDNEDCTTRSPSVDTPDQAVVALVREYEAEWSCAVDTSRSRIETAALSRLKRLQDLPVVTGYESSCIGWQGAPFALRRGRGQAAQIIGQVSTGDSILWAHHDIDGWSYVTALAPDGRINGFGWMPVMDNDLLVGSCDGLAG